MMKQVILIAVLCLTVSGQTAYNRLGYGNLDPVTDALESSLGNGVIALHDTARITLHNPASLHSLKRVFFGFSLRSDFISSNEVMSNITRLEQFSIALPIGMNIGMSLGAHAVTDFEANYVTDIESGKLSEYSSGGIWDYQIGLGYSINSQLSLGLKMHMYQGVFRRELKLDSQNSNEFYVLKGDINGRSAELGMISEFGELISFAITADIPYKLPAVVGVDSLGGTLISQDFNEVLSAWPTTIRLGLVYHYDKYTKITTGIGQQIFPESGFEDSHLFALPDGLKPVPVASIQVSLQHLAMDYSSRYMLKRTGWQIGLSAKNHYLAPSNNQLIYEYALISGINMGLKNGKSLFDISSELGLRQGFASLPDELFARIRFGIQVSDTWFRKVKRR